MSATQPYLADPDVTLLLGDALECLRGLGEGSVNAVVTSPPYADARRDVECVSTDEFPAWLVERLHPLLRVLRPGGSMMLNLGRRFRHGEELDYADESVRLLRLDGWKRIDTLIWHKPNANGRGGPYLRDCHEYAYWLAPSVTAYRGLDDARRPYRDPDRYSRGYTAAAKGEPRKLHRRTLNPLGARPDSIFYCPISKEKGRKHPTPMALGIAEQLVKLTCPRGGVVLDPFMGEGTTGRAARKLERRFIGIDIEERWCAEAADRLSQQSIFAGAAS